MVCVVTGFYRLKGIKKQVFNNEENVKRLSNTGVSDTDLKNLQKCVVLQSKEWYKLYQNVASCNVYGVSQGGKSRISKIVLTFCSIICIVLLRNCK